MNKPYFSIITACYNSAKTIERTIKSVLDQSYDSWEYIIVDGKSTDNTLEIVNAYAKKENRIRVISEPDHGIYDAMNKGIGMAQGILIGMVNSDDYYEKDALQNIQEAYKGTDYEIVYGMQRNWAVDGRIMSIIFNHHDFMEQAMICHPTCFITKKLYAEIGMYSLQYKSSSDYDFMIRMHRDNRVVFTPVYKIISNFAYGGMSDSVEAHLETFKIWRKYGCISKKRYWMIVLSTRIKQIIH